MKLFWCCVLAALLAVSKAALDVEKTVKQVQNILQANEQLPRLSRDEILQLLHDIRSEDAKSSASKESKEEIKNKSNVKINEISKEDNIEDNYVLSDKGLSATTTAQTFVESTTKHYEPSLMVVLPYTPRDGASLQELYTRPPRTEVVQLPSTTVAPKTVKPKEKIKEPYDQMKLASNPINDFPAELQAFLDAHGLKGMPGQDNFLLPLEGFKPLPPARVVDGTVQLPENILLTYDLISPSSDKKTRREGPSGSNNYLYEPLKPELPFELDTSSSETKEISLPYDMPVRITKSVETPNYEPIDYESVKVIPLNKGLNPINEEINGSNEQSKRQANSSTEAPTENTTEPVTTEASTTTTEEPKTNVVSDSVSADTDTGASIADLEDSFGGALPAEPGGSQLPPPKKNGFYWMLDWNSFLEVGDGDTKVNIRFEPKLGDPQMFLPVSVP